MKWALVFILAIHGLIHLMGFVREFNLATISGFSGETMIPLSKPVSTISGALWLAACATFLATAIGFLLHRDWWMPGLAAVLVSQALIVLYWKDAKWGTIANILVLLPVLVSLAEWKFTKSVNKEIDTFLSEPISANTMITQERLSGLPVPVQKWLRRSGILGKEMTQSVRLKQKGLMRLKPESNNWVEASAVQYFRWDKPAFIWKVKMNMMPLVPVTGRDRLENGKAAMQIKAFSLIPIVNQTDAPKLNESAAQRLLSEICWSPFAALHPSIAWEAIDETTARATIHLNDVSGTVMFRFTEEGDLVACQADRYKDSDEKAKREKWEVINTRYGVLNGIRMPLESEVTWKLKDGDFTWFKIIITDIEYNTPKRFEDE